jgi:glycosyltransferase involved in cell wall biosynthesis
LKKKVAIIGTNGLPAKYGGFETLTNYLTIYLKDQFDFIVYCSKTDEKKKLKEVNNAKLVYLPFKANGWQSLIYDAFSIIHALFFFDILIILGSSGVFAFPFKMLFSKKIIFNIGGIEWQKVRGAKLFAKIEVPVKKIFEKICVKYSDVVVADNKVIYDYVVKNYNTECILAEYGGDQAKFTPISDEVSQKYPFINLQYDISISRAQEDMNIHILLEAYKNNIERNLVVISNWEITEYGRKLKEDFKDKFNNIFLLDAIYNIEELNILRSNAKIYLHSHSLCGTAPSLVEAMSIGLPVICFDVDTNRATTEEKSLYFNSSLSLEEILKGIKIEQISKLGIEMKEIADRRYNWERITDLYRNIIN